MPGLVSNSGESLVPFSSDVSDPLVYHIQHCLKPPISRLSIAWSRGNCLRVSFFRPESYEEIGGKVVEVKLNNGDEEFDDSQKRKIAYGSFSPFAVFQNQKNSFLAMSKMSYHLDWSHQVMEYSRQIISLLGVPRTAPSSVIDDPRTVLKTDEEPTCLKAARELLKIFYADKESHAWLPECLVDWLTDNDSLLSTSEVTVHSKLVDLQNELVNLQAIEDDRNYWEGISSALAVGCGETIEIAWLISG